MTPRALVVGGTGQTGPGVVRGLVDRGFEVTLLHGGQHEVPLPPVEHIHADVHFPEPIADALDGRTFDLAVCMYGRSRHVADALVGRVPRLVLVTGAGYAYYEPRLPGWGPFGATVADESAPFSSDREADKIGPLISATERHVLEHQEAGHYTVTILRYPNIFGPGAVSAVDWSIIRRALDRRPYFIVADGGLRLRSRCYKANASHAVLLAIDHADVAAGQIYNVADDPPALSMGQWVQAVAEVLGHRWELVSLPIDVVDRVYLGQFGYHRLVDTTKIRTELGYRDVVPPAEALRATVEWWAEHGPATAKSVEQTMADRFDYEAEDQLVRVYRAATRQMFDHAPPPLVWAHPFRHPQKPGDAWADRLVIEDGSRTTALPTRTYPYDLAPVAAVSEPELADLTADADRSGPEARPAEDDVAVAER